MVPAGNLRNEGIKGLNGMIMVKTRLGCAFSLGLAALHGAVNGVLVGPLLGIVIQYLCGMFPQQ